MLRISNCVSRVTSSETSNVHQMPFRRYASKTNKMKKLMTEFKFVFGKLLEKNTEKKKRLELENIGKIPVQKRNKTDTELPWVMQQPRNNIKRIIVSAKERSESEDANRINPTNSPEHSITGTLEDKKPANQNAKNTFHSKSDQSTQKRTQQKITQQSTDENKVAENNNFHDGTSSSRSDMTDTENAAAKCSVSEKFFDIVVKNIQSFSVMDNKQVSVELTETLSIPAKDDVKTIKFPSVTRILTHTMSPESKLALDAWKKRMTEKLGKEGFDKYQKALLNDGSSLHTCIAHNLQGKEYEIPSRIEPVFNSVRSVLKDVSHVKAIEAHVAHTKLRYKGIVDCVASYRGEDYVIDWKKSDKKKLDLKETYDAPMQVAAYIGAINASNLYPFVVNVSLK
ncbi:mitochondrial genome maintenance exonuclease 1 isoform X2 [Harpegnathos saltator]|uniref:mitochondrial genome maintenance exonuclease 1 isoform X2 n=1 Tax=Harpegnathos saltator TaxID=610380 RepID=UPI000DBEE60C|nr:mitochondrial genome maintenance exonuclease 1 isoform X2 [Harpegnathos saltator]